MVNIDGEGTNKNCSGAGIIKLEWCRYKKMKSRIKNRNDGCSSTGVTIEGAGGAVAMGPVTLEGPVCPSLAAQSDLS